MYVNSKQTLQSKALELKHAMEPANLEENNQHQHSYMRSTTMFSSRLPPEFHFDWSEIDQLMYLITNLPHKEKISTTP
jgi:hypothetical protein